MNSILDHKQSFVNRFDSVLSPKVAAVILAGIGLRVFPACGFDENMQPVCYSHENCPEGRKGKHAIERGWQRSATTEMKQIEAMWVKYPYANLGIRTGDGIIVLDEDPRNGGTDSFYDLQYQYGALPDTLTIATGGGGWQHYLRCPPGIAVPCHSEGKKLGRGIDIKGQGGCVIGPGSTHKSGQRYDFEASTDFDNLVIAECPAWLLELVTGTAPTKTEQRPQRIPAPKKHRPGISFPSFVPHGQRHGFLLSEAQYLRDTGMGRDRTAFILRAYREHLCEPVPGDPITDNELGEILVWTFETAEPRPHRKPGPSAGALRVHHWLCENSDPTPNGMRRCAATINEVMNGAGLKRGGVQDAFRSLERHSLLIVEQCPGSPNTYLIRQGGVVGV